MSAAAETRAAPRTLAEVRRRDAWRYHATWLVVGLVVLGAAALLDLREGRVCLGGLALPEMCAWRRLLGWTCPGCGLTRAVVAAVAGRWAEAWRLHPAGLVLAAALAVQTPYRAWQLARLRQGRDPWQGPAARVAAWVVIGSLGAAFAWRIVTLAWGG